MTRRNRTPRTPRRRWTDEDRRIAILPVLAFLLIVTLLWSLA